MDTEMLASMGQRHGFPYYLYNENIVAQRLTVLAQTFEPFTILYSVKTNPHPSILRFMAKQGLGADAASSYEVDKADRSGFAPEAIFYSAPGKTDEQLASALGRCTVIADSWGELERLEKIAAEKGLGQEAPIPVGLRINPDMAYGPGEFPGLVSGLSMKFGVDEESLAPNAELLASLRHISIRGLHVFLRSQVLSHEAISAYIDRVFRLAIRCRDQYRWQLDFLNFGGGLGIPPQPDTADLDMATLKERIDSLVRQYSSSLPGCTLLLESGRYLVGNAGSFVTRIEDVKESRGKTWVLAPGGLSGFLRPSIMNLFNSLPDAGAGPYEPIYSNPQAHQVALPGKNGPQRTVTVSGNLCTALDVLAADISLPDPQVGDILTVSNAGAYAATLSPFAFASFPRPAELYRDAAGKLYDVNGPVD